MVRCCLLRAIYGNPGCDSLSDGEMLPITRHACTHSLHYSLQRGGPAERRPLRPSLKENRTGSDDLHADVWWPRLQHIAYTPSVEKGFLHLTACPVWKLCSTMNKTYGQGWPASYILALDFYLMDPVADLQASHCACAIGYGGLNMCLLSPECQAPPISQERFCT
eukprot:1162076-Pelagomonas_calceolata.AAC.10